LGEKGAGTKNDMRHMYPNEKRGRQKIIRGNLDTDYGEA
jgi:hypothetical protein